MKTLIIIVLLLLLGGISRIAIAQKVRNLPRAILTDFSAKYPQAHLKHWKLENNQYIASFVMDKRECEATYSNNGTWVSTEITFRHVLRHLTPEIRTSLRNSSYASYHIDEVKNLKMPSRDIYLLTIDNNSGNMSAYENAGSVDMETLYFSHNGRLIKSMADNQ